MKFSVLMSLYYKENPDNLKLSLQSVLGNSLLPNEVVLVIDGPISKELESVLEEFKGQLKLVPLNKNVGLSSALNEGLKHCSFELVARMDTDDICFPNRFQKQIDVFNSKNVDLVGGYAMNISNDGIEQNIRKVPSEHNDIYNLMWACPFIHPSVMFRKSMIVKIGGYNPNIGDRIDDYELWFRCAKNGLQFMNIKEPLIYYRVSNDRLKKNNIKGAWKLFKVGCVNSYDLGLPFKAYVGLLYPLLRHSMPYPLNMYFSKLVTKIDPRKK